ncbi:hypothetical protein M408DRAFT_152666 [Serendipita vermifera MAFF 305830]|uniref:Uncharacterized protein n=1 Tax=Serendipita vermifera MAFF 305830 TaxID=933852 RepID=A0A0C3BPE3_SERVB|nr:hypothetical protein M408DRAFT_152666 [Serendipita vermifera MAFF 305830]
MLGVFHQVLPPSGAEFATFVNFGNTTLLPNNPGYLTHLAVARDNFLRLYEIREDPSSVKNDVNGTKQDATPRLFLVRQHTLHGIITGLASVQTLASEIDQRDRLLVSFKDAKLALLEWSDVLYDISTVSIHSYERSSHVVNADFTNSSARLRTDPGHRCAALCLPGDNIAILPWYQTQAELEFADSSEFIARDLPYSPSYVVEYAAMHEEIRNVVDLVFLPGFNTPTIAVMFQPDQTWTGRLKENKDNTRIFIISLDLVAKSYQVISRTENLPYDTLYLIPCSSKIGGVLIVSATSIIHVDQASKVTALALSGWAVRTTEIPFIGREPTEDMRLEGSQAAFVNDTTLLLVLASGTTYKAILEREGRLIRQITLSSPLGASSPPSAILVDRSLVFVASTSDRSVLWNLISSTSKTSTSSDTKIESNMEIDLYGDEPLQINDSGSSEGANSKSNIVVIDSIEDPGLATAATFCHNNTSDEPLLITASGLNELGGFTLLRRALPTRIKKKMPAIAGRKGIWSMRISQEPRGSKSSTRAVSSLLDDNVLFSTDATPAPASRIASKSQAKLDVNITTRLPMQTVACAPFFGKTHILQVTTNSLRLLSPDGSEKQTVKDTDGNMTRPKIRSACIMDPYVLIVREDDTLGLFVGEPSRGKVRRKDMSAFGDKVDFPIYYFDLFCLCDFQRLRYAAATFFEDTLGRFRVVDLGSQSANSGTPGDGAASQWIILCRTSGIMEIWTLPKLALVYSTEYKSGSLVMQDNFLEFVPPDPDTPDNAAEEILEDVVIADMGEHTLIPYILLLFKSGLIISYQTCPAPNLGEVGKLERRSTLNVHFVKNFARKLEPLPLEEGATPAPLALAATRTLVPFSTTDADGRRLSGLFLTGDRPRWFLKWDKSELLCFPCEYSVVYAFTACSMWDSTPTFLMNTAEGASLVEWTQSLSFHGQFAFERIRKGRTYSNVAFDPSSSLVIAASHIDRDFVLYDDEGVCVWEQDAPNVAYPTLPVASLELIDPQTWVTIDGFEFATNEVVNAAETVRLETLSTPSGSKDFVAVATSVHRGEDLAVRGATYIFEIVEVVPDTERRGKRHHKLKLLCREDAKGPVTALCGMNGYLVSSMGQKVFVRAFDLDERLVGVAFLDAGVYITSLRCLKNFLVISDAVKSIWFVAFQEDPFKLIVLSRDARPLSLLSSEFFFSGNDLELVSLDTKGVLRFHVYDPTHVATEEGARLLCVVEFQTHGEMASVIRIAKRQTSASAATDASKLVIVDNNGSMSTIDSLGPDAYKRLYLLQGQLIRNTQHFASLNPRNHRAPPGNPLGRGSLKGILDAELLVAFKSIPFGKQSETAALIGESRETILRDCAYLEDERWDL